MSQDPLGGCIVDKRYRSCRVLKPALACVHCHHQHDQHALLPDHVLPCLISLQDFVIAGGSPEGTVAVITQPLSYVRGSTGHTTTLTLDARNSRPRPGTSITQYVWAVITLPDKEAVTNSTGRITQVQLQPGARMWQHWQGHISVTYIFPLFLGDASRCVMPASH